MEPPLPHFFFPTSIPIFCEDNESTIEFLLMKKKSGQQMAECYRKPGRCGSQRFVVGSTMVD